MTTSTTPSVAKDSVTSASREGLGECIGGPTTTKHEVFCLALVSEDLKASETKTCAPRRYWRRRFTHQEVLRHEGLWIEKISKAKALEMKT